MTDQAATGDAELDAKTDGEGETEGEARKASGKMPGKKLVLFIALPLVVLVLAGVGVYFSGLADPWLGKGEGEGAQKELLGEVDTGPSVYYELPEMLVNLNSSGRRTGYLKISVSLELGSEADREHVEQVLPRVIDNFQVYLRELRIEDLQGSAGLQRLREELLLRVASAAQPAVVKDVLFREMLIQ
ncbi:MAG: flagellar basal body-associated FliL family protein [Kiloniellaceae bacterium]